MHPANEKRSYNATSPLIGWAHSQNDTCTSHGTNVIYLLLDTITIRCLKSSATQMFVQQFSQATNKGNIISALVALCERNPPMIGGFPKQTATYAESHSMSCLFNCTLIKCHWISTDCTWVCVEFIPHYKHNNVHHTRLAFHYIEKVKKEMTKILKKENIIE